MQALQRREPSRAVHHVHAGQPEPREVGEYLAYRRVQRALRLARHQAEDELHRRLAQDAGRLALGVAVDGSARRILGASLEARHAQRLRRNPRRVPVLPPQIGGTSARRGVEPPPRGEGRVRPAVVVPTGAHDPRVPWQRLRALLHAPQRLVEAGAATEIDGQLAVGQALEVDMRVDQARPHLAAQAHDLGLPPGRRARAWTDGEDALPKGRHLGLASGEQDRLGGQIP